MQLRPLSTNLPHRGVSQVVRRNGGWAERHTYAVEVDSAGCRCPHKSRVMRSLRSCAVCARLAHKLIPRSHWSEQVLHNAMQISVKLGNLFRTPHLFTVQGDVQVESIQGNTHMYNFLLPPFYEVLNAWFLHAICTCATDTKD